MKTYACYSLIFAISGLTALAGQPTVTTITWQQANGDWSGNYTNAQHWAGGVVPDALCQAKVQLSGLPGRVVTNTFPAGTFETKASQKWNVTGTENMTLLWYGAGTSFRMPTAASDNYLDEPFRIEYTGNHFFNYQCYSDAAAIRYKHAIAKIDDGVFRLSSPKTSGDAVRLDFDAGTFNFDDPEGTSYLTPYFRVGHNRYDNDIAITFHPGVTMKLPGLVVPNNLPSDRTLLFDVNRAAVSVNGAFIMPQNDAYTERDTITRFVVTNRAALTFMGTATLGANVAGSATYDTAGRGYAYGKRYYFDVADGGTLTFTNTLLQSFCGDTFFTVGDGGTLTFDAYTVLGGENAKGTVTVKEGGRLTGAGMLTLGSSKASAAHLIVDGGTVDYRQIDLGFTKEETAVSSFVMTNAAKVTTTNFFLGYGAVTVPDGTEWQNPGLLYTGYMYDRGEKSRLEVTGGKLYAGGLRIGQKASVGTLDVSGGMVMVHDGIQLGVESTATGVVNVTGGTLTLDPASTTKATNARLNVGAQGRGVLNISGGAVTNYAIYVPYCTGSGAYTSGELNMSGGSMIVSDSLGVGNGGAGTFNLSGGYVKTLYLFLGQSSAASQDAWATFRQTGGLMEITTVDNDLGIKMADHATRKSRLILDGGVMSVTHIFGHVGAKCRGGTGYAALSANGGTLRVPSVTKSKRLIYTLDEAKVGPKGLTVDARAACTIEQDFTDTEDAEGQGRLILAGPATKTLCATNSSCSYVVAADGTTLFAPNGTLQAVQDSSVIVTNNATVSLVGDQTGLTVRDLTLGNAVSEGVLALDPTDTLTVTGTLTIVRGLIRVNGTLAADTPYTFLTLAGDQSAALTQDWAHLRVVSTADPAACHAVSVTYDAEAGQTKITAQKVDVSAGLTTATWQATGDAAWATAANWADATPPGLMVRAAFTSETATNAVTLAKAERAAGLTFAADRGYTLSGGAIVLTPHPDMAIAVSKGTNTVASEIVAQDTLPVTVGTGAQLDVTGDLTVGTLVKDGKGRFVLTNRVNMVEAVILSNGVMAVAAPAALPDTATITQTAGTLAWPAGTAAAPAAYPQDIAFGSIAGTTNIFAWHVTGDVATRAPARSGKGLFYKHGAGRLTWSPTGAKTRLAYGDGMPGDWKPGTDPVELDADGNVVKTMDLGGFNISEGEVVLAKGAAGTSFLTDTFIVIGRTQKGASTPATLTLDGATVDANTSGKHVLLGPSATADNTALDASFFNMRNDAWLKANTYYVGRQSTRSGQRWYTHVDCSTLECTYGLQANTAVNIKNTLSVFTFTNSAQCLTPVVSVPARAAFTFDHATLAGCNGAACRILHNFNYSSFLNYSGADFLFRNAAYLKCSEITVYGWPEKPTTLTFDNAEWDPGKDDFKLVVDYPSQLKVIMANTGAIFAPAAEKTWRLAHPLTGTGGLVKRGEGTLVFMRHERVDPSTHATNAYDAATTTLDFTGTAAIEAGTLKIEAGAAAAGASFDVGEGAVLDFDGATAAAFSVTGCGTVRHATLSATTLPVTVTDAGETTSDLPVFDLSSVTFGQMTVDLGRTASTALPWPMGPLVVGRYTGTAPGALVGWRVRNTGLEGVSGVFAAADGQIIVTLKRTGLFITLH